MSSPNPTAEAPAPAQPLAIESTGLNFAYGKARVLHDLALAVPQGSIYGFLGHNGAGKTTTIRLLLGLMQPTSGSLRVFGLEHQSHRIDILKRMGALIEEPALYRHLTGPQHLRLYAPYFGASKARMGEVLEIVGLQHATKKRVKQYSQGMRQRLGVAIALLGNPDLIVLDEPTNGLDPQGMMEMRLLVQRLAQEQRKTVFVSSHILAELEKMATHVGVIHHGKLRFQGSMQELQARRQKQLVRLRTNDSPAARTTLEQAGYTLKGNGHEAGQLDFYADGQGAIAQATRLLVQAGLAVYGLEAQNSLEELFFALVNEESPTL